MAALISRSNGAIRPAATSLGRSQTDLPNNGTEDQIRHLTEGAAELNLLDTAFAKA